MKTDSKLPLAGSKVRKTTLVVEAREREPSDEELDDLELRELDDDFVLPAPTMPPSSDAQPNPVELPAPINPEGGRKQSVELHRNLFCHHYDNCLDEAVKRSWNSFSCVRCGLYQMSRGEEEGGVAKFATQRRAS